MNIVGVTEWFVELLNIIKELPLHKNEVFR